MGDQLAAVVKEVCGTFGNDRTRMMDIVKGVQTRLGCVPGEAMTLIAKRCSTHRVEVESVVSFYAFLDDAPKGKVVIRLCNDPVDLMHGYERVAAAFKEALGIDFGQTTPDGLITLEQAPCIGMCDQAPAALVNDIVVPRLSTDRARDIVDHLRSHKSEAKLARVLGVGDGNNAHPLVHAAVANNLRRRGEVVFADFAPGSGLSAALAISPAEVIRSLKTSRLRGRGGAGFPCGMKWEFTRAATGEPKYILCNADEGEPGTFKDRVILTEAADLLFEGMTIGGYAIGAAEGLVYLRAEYAYLRAYLESVLAERRQKGLLGKNILGKAGFDFDIRIQMGAGAYVCGEETALISSLEGLRGDPKNRPPFPAQKGYLGQPSVVNNVETFCCVARIMDKGAAWFAQLGTSGSSGTKLFSVSGACDTPGVYELPFGTTVTTLLGMAGAADASAVLVGGPSGQFIDPSQFDRKLEYDDLATGGSVVIFGPGQDILAAARDYLDFFIEESCGYCTPCRVGNVLLRERLDKIIRGLGEPSDLAYLQELGETVRTASRCGLGQTSANPVLSTLKNFRGLYEERVKERPDGLVAGFDIRAALGPAMDVTGRQSVHFGQNH